MHCIFFFSVTTRSLQHSSPIYDFPSLSPPHQTGPPAAKGSLKPDVSAYFSCPDSPSDIAGTGHAASTLGQLTPLKHGCGSGWAWAPLWNLSRSFLL